MLVAVGLALAFGVMKMANFAHGEFFMAGAYVVYVAYGLGGWPFPLAVLLAMPVVAVLGLVTERLIFRPTRDNILAGFMATAGLSFMLQVIVGRIWGVGLPRAVPTPYMGAAEIFGAFVGWQRLVVIPCTALMLVALHVFLYKTKIGRALRACTEDPETAASYGININVTTAVAMMVAGASAGLAGALMAPEYSVSPYMGHNVVLTAFIVVIVGGLASVQGAMLAGALLAFIHTFATTLWDSTIATMIGVGFMAITLVLRPSGLLGKSLPEVVSSEGAHHEVITRLPELGSRAAVYIGAASLMAAICVAPFTMGAYYVEVLIIFLVNIILASSYRVLTTTGDWSLSHVVLMGVGAYAAALMAKLFGWPFWATVPLAGVAAGAIGLAFAFPLLRTRGFGFFIASFALGELVRLIWIRVENPFGGSRGMINVPLAAIGDLQLSGSIAYYFVVAGIALICLVLMYRIEHSRMGTAWFSIHSDTALARSIGINVERHRLYAFAIGSFFAGVAGALLVHHMGAVDPKGFSLTVMIYLIIWVVVGGTATFWGPIIGVATVTLAFELTRPLLEWRPFIFGFVLILFLIFLPGGIESLLPRGIAAIGRWWPARGRRRGTSPIEND